MKRKILPASLLLLMMALISIGGMSLTSGQADAGKAIGDRLITVLNPAIGTRMVERVPLGPRLNTLEGKTIYLYDTQWGGPDAAYSVYEEMQGWFSKNMPSVKTVLYRGTGWMTDDPGFLKVVTDKKVDGVVLGIAG
jgi:hypothetical protein